MTNPNKTAIAVVLDRSGSMGSCRNDTIGGFNTFLEEQQKLPGYATLTLAQFDDVYEVVYLDRPIKEVPKLTTETFVPRGSTALCDAIGRTIVTLGAKLAAMPEVDRPGKVVVVIITDGGENASHEYTREKIKALTEHQQAKYEWKFVYLGANQDAISVGSSLGMLKSMSASYSVDNTRQVFGAMGANVAGYVMAAAYQGVGDKELAFSDEQRATLLAPEPQQ